MAKREDDTANDIFFWLKRRSLIIGYFILAVGTTLSFWISYNLREHDLREIERQKVEDCKTEQHIYDTLIDFFESFTQSVPEGASPEATAEIDEINEQIEDVVARARKFLVTSEQCR